MSSLVNGQFTSRQQAEQAVSELVRAGFAPDHISLLASDAPPVDRAPSRRDGRAHRVAAIAAGLGGAMGALAGGVAAASATTPDLPILASGPLVLALSGFAAGTAVGGLAGAIVGQGARHRSAVFVPAPTEGDGIVADVFVQDERDQLARSVLETCGAEPIRE